MITSISMSNFAVYLQKTELSYCKKINLIYGNNGTGKTLLSNYLMDPAQPSYADCKITWEDNRSLPVYVFNKKFCDNNFRKTNIPGIYTLGRENVNIEIKMEDIEDEISAQMEKLSSLQSEYDSLKKKKDEKEAICSDALWDRAKTYKQLLGEFFTKPVGKSQCLTKIQNLYYKNRPNVPGLLELKRKADVLKTQKEVQYSVYPHLDVSGLVSIENDPIWSGSALCDTEPVFPKSDKDKRIAEWIRQGIQFADGDNICPFCEQEFPAEDFRERIAQRFSEKTDPKAAQYNILLSQYETTVQRILYTADRILKQNRDEGSAFLETAKFSDMMTNLRNLFHANILLMIRKKESSEQQEKIQSCFEYADALNRMIDDSNYQAHQANALLENIRRSKSELKKDSWNSYCTESEYDIRNLHSALYNIEHEMEKLQFRIDRIDAEIRDLETEKEKLLRNSVNIWESVDKINEDLNLLGIGNFSLKISEDSTHYNILRNNGTDASETLSDGEKTLIMLLYFLQLVEGASSKDTLKTERIIVIDDPVSNLDDATLNAVLERIGQLISRILDGDPYIRQLFVLSHRKECTKKLRSCDSRLEDEQNAGLWILKKKNGITLAQEFV